MNHMVTSTADFYSLSRGESQRGIGWIQPDAAHMVNYKLRVRAACPMPSSMRVHCRKAGTSSWNLSVLRRLRTENEQREETKFYITKTGNEIEKKKPVGLKVRKKSNEIKQNRYKYNIYDKVTHEIG